MSMNEIQRLRKELAILIKEKVKPLKQELDNLLVNEAIRLCPFSIGDVIILDNGKKGIINNIDYYTLDYDFKLEHDHAYPDFFPKQECDIDYKFAYQIDDGQFSITWKFSGLRMIQNDTKVGKTSFTDINPVNYLIDKENKSVKSKNLNEYIDNVESILFLDDLVLNKHNST